MSKPSHLRHARAKTRFSKSEYPASFGIEVVHSASRGSEIGEWSTNVILPNLMYPHETTSLIHPDMRLWADPMSLTEFLSAWRRAFPRLPVKHFREDYLQRPDYTRRDVYSIGLLLCYSESDACGKRRCRAASPDCKPYALLVFFVIFFAPQNALMTGEDDITNFTRRSAIRCK